MEQLYEVNCTAGLFTGEHSSRGQPHLPCTRTNTSANAHVASTASSRACCISRTARAPLDKVSIIVPCALSRENAIRFTTLVDRGPPHAEQCPRLSSTVSAPSVPPHQKHACFSGCFWSRTATA